MSRRTLRTFFAVPLTPTPELLDVWRRLNQLAPLVRCVARDNLHITLKFVGETEENDVKALADLMPGIVADAHEISAEMVGLGAFPNQHQPRVVWAGLTPVDWLETTAMMLELGCEVLGCEPETRPFRPHVTLARVKPPRHRQRGGRKGDRHARQPARSAKPGRDLEHLTGLFEECDSRPLGSVLLNELVLYASDLGPEGPVYTPLAATRLPPL